jgi:hypothetical protein
MVEVRSSAGGKRLEEGEELYEEDSVHEKKNEIMRILNSRP